MIGPTLPPASCSRALALVLVLIADGALSAQASPTLQIPESVFVRPTGLYAVGMQEALWVDAGRSEPFTKDLSDQRHVMVRIWYPAQDVPGADRAPYLLDVNEFGENVPPDLLEAGHRLRTNAVLDAPPAKPRQGEAFPVLLYEPGGGGSRFSGTFETEQLASHGYVVVASDHAGFSDTRHFPDGYDFDPDTMTQPPNAATPQETVRTVDEWLGRDVFPTWTADATFVLDQLPRLNEAPGPLHHLLDLDRIGMFGWSFGGATSVEMSRIDARVKAAVDQDGRLFGDVVQRGTERPVLLMLHGNKAAVPQVPGAAALSKKMATDLEEGYRSMFAHSTGDCYEITIPRTQHGNFGDGVLFTAPRPGDMDPRRAHDIIVAYVTAFFDRYLRGIDSPLLRGPSTAYPEVELRKVR